ncbi:MAG: adenylate/guanylate cyclase domain-containing protein, partial [Actinomycetota bacterium]|nr:adenylate/guanylate cyclase domain-containing protein [Actinomycetota bacterium]
MVCTNCGSDNKSTRRFCRECGHPLKLICPVCGASNDAADKFCGGCGVTLDEVSHGQASDANAALSRDPHERRFVTVLFADLVGFTQFSEARDAEVVRAALTTYFDHSRDVISSFGGVVEKFIGDAVMAVWGATVAHEDDAERAVRAGMELTDVVARIGDELDGGALSLRVGVLTGEASVAPATPEQGFIVGDLVNTASRLQSIAEPGTVVVGGTTYSLLQHVVQFEPLGEHPLKGKTAPVAVWRAVRVKTDGTQRARGGAWEPAFVSRQEELRLLKDALHATEREGRSRLVSIVGEAGIGKTRLAEELRKYVGGLARDIYWHDGRSPAYDQGLTSWALGEMVRQRAGIAETDDLLRSRTKLRTAVAEYVPLPSDQDWIEPRLAALLGLEEVSPGERGEFFAAIVSFFQHIAERGTTLLVFEDFHWADPGLIEFVSELVERSTRHPILILTLARPDLLDRAPGWGAGRRNFTSAHLGPLTDAEMVDLVTEMVQGIGEDLATTVTERANGIPLYAVELVRMLLADGDLVADDHCCTPTRDLSTIRVPDTVRAVVEARLDRVAPDARALLQDAAVLGAAFTCAGLAAMSGLDTSRLEKLLEPLVHRELLEFESDSRSPERGQYRFVQTMIREVAYGRLTRGERRVRHVRAAEFFAELGDLELAGAVANHYMAAHRVTDDAEQAKTLAAEATGALSDAADRAAGLHSHAQALDMIEQALGFMTDPAAEAALWKRAALSASALAQHETAVGYAYRALDWYRGHGDPIEVADSAALVGSELCHAFRAPEAIEILEPIVSEDPALADPAHVAAAAELARAYLMALRNEDAAALGDRVIAPAQHLDLIPTIVDTLITRGTALGNMGRMHEAIALLRGAAVAAKDHDLPLPEMRAANNLGHLLAYDDHVGAMDACRAGMEQANRLGDVRFIGSFSWAVSAYLDRDGRFEKGQALRDEVRDRIELPASSVLWYEMTDLAARVERGDDTAVALAYDAVRRSLDEANPQSQASVPLAKAALDILTGELEAAYDEVMGVDDVHRLPDHLAAATVAAAMLRDIDRLEAVIAGLTSSRARGRLLRAIGHAASAAVAALRGHTDEAVAGFSKALE